MQPAQHAMGRAGQIILHEGPADAVLHIACGLIGFQEEAPLVSEQLRVYDQNVWNFSRDDVHIILPITLGLNELTQPARFVAF